MSGIFVALHQRSVDFISIPTPTLPLSSPPLWLLGSGQKRRAKMEYLAGWGSWLLGPQFGLVTVRSDAAAGGGPVGEVGVEGTPG